jgi:hypothetical protein
VEVRSSGFAETIVNVFWVVGATSSVPWQEWALSRHSCLPWDAVVQIVPLTPYSESISSAVLAVDTEPGDVTVATRSTATIAARARR